MAGIGGEKVTPGIYNFLTENKISTVVDIPTEPAAPQPTLIPSLVPYYSEKSSVWVQMPDDLTTELDYLTCVGFAITQNDRNYIDLAACQKLYAAENGIFVGESVSNEKRAALRNMYMTHILPTYARMTAILAEGLPDTTYDGRRARELATEIQAAQTRLDLL